MLEAFQVESTGLDSSAVKSRRKAKYRPYSQHWVTLSPPLGSADWNMSIKRLKRPRAMRAGPGRCNRSLLTHPRLVYSLTPRSRPSHAHQTRNAESHAQMLSVKHFQHHQLPTSKSKQVQNPSLLTADRGPFTDPPRPSQRGKARRVLTREFSCRKRLSRGMQRGMACSAPSPASGPLCILLASRACGRVYSPGSRSRQMLRWLLRQSDSQGDFGMLEAGVLLDAVS